MPSVENLLEYKEFMQWFKINYPDLFEKFSLNIMVPQDNKGLKVSMFNIDKRTYNLLFEIQNEYYLATK